MQERKERAYNEHRELIECLLFMGKGLMFRKHLIKYFTLLGHPKKKIEGAIRDLIASDLVETYHFANNHVLKLKKYGIYRILDKEPVSVDSIPVTVSKIMRTAFVNARILHELSGRPELLMRDFSKVSATIQYTTSYVALRNRGYETLEYLLERDQDEERKAKIFSDAAPNAIKELKMQYEHLQTGKWENEVKRIKIRNEILNETDLNTMQSRDIHFSVARNAGGYLLQVDFIDLHSSMKEQDLIEKIKQTVNYTNGLFSDYTQLQINVLVASEARVAYFQSKVNRIIRAVMEDNIHIEGINIIDLDLEETLFARMTIIT